MNYLHSELASWKWFQLSLAKQLGNIGSEVHRARLAIHDQERYKNAIIRALELFELTLQDPRWKKRLKEIARAREIFCDAILGGQEYNSSLEDLDRYFTYFAIAARKAR